MQTEGLRGRTALVTGGGTGVGLGIARSLLRREMRVTLAARRLEVLEDAAGSLRDEMPGAEVRCVRCDVTREDEVASAVAAARAGGERLDLAVANAGSGALGPVLLARPEDWLRILELNVVGSLLTIKHAALSMRDTGGGAIVAISSPAAVQAMEHLGPYSPSKAGLEMLVRVAALELARFGVRVNAVRPGLVVQEHLRALMQVPGMRENLESGAPLRAEGSGEEVGDAVAFLAGPESAWVTGQILGVDGGLSIWRGPSFEPVVRAAFGDEAVDGPARPAPASGRSGGEA
jgi:NAD(P)-dependent dehydrogenase (short-subunit alcohol dehydrogenase family)